jgi:hypothetical protein
MNGNLHSDSGTIGTTGTIKADEIFSTCHLTFNRSSIRGANKGLNCLNLLNGLNSVVTRVIQGEQEGSYTRRATFDERRRT